MVVIKECPKCKKPKDICKCPSERPKVAPAPQPIPITKIQIEYGKI